MVHDFPQKKRNGLIPGWKLRNRKAPKKKRKMHMTFLWFQHASDILCLGMLWIFPENAPI